MKSNPKVIAIASTGGHYVQLGRIIEQAEFSNEQVVFVRTRIGNNDVPNKSNETLISEISRDSLWRIPIIFFQLFILILKVRPAWIITTGAMPGLVGVVVGRILFRKTLWIDSIANTKRLSASGRIAKYFSHKVLTQWPDIAGKGIDYKGKVI